jgi:8-oxo-dGTP diphosphatase
LKDHIKNVIGSIVPFDNIERKDIKESCEWIASGIEIFRIKKPDIPPKHLVSYGVLIDENIKKLLLIDHVKAQLWLPPGGHLEKSEDPEQTIKRELQEELGIKAQFIANNPFFITVTETVNIEAGHTDVSLWYLVRGDSTKKFNFDKKEMNGYKWFSFEEILRSKSYAFDPQMKRFTKKLLS